MSTTTTPKGEQTQQLIIDGACALFLERGYHGTSMRQIATAVNLAQSGIYNHFASKEAIFQAVVVAKHPILRILPQIIEVDAPTAAEMLHTAVDMILAELATQPEIVNLIFIEMIEFQGEHLGQLIDPTLANMGAFMARLQSKPDLRPLPPQVILRGLISFLIGFVITEQLLLRHPTFSLNDIQTDVYLEGLLHGLIAQ